MKRMIESKRREMRERESWTLRRETDGRTGMEKEKEKRDRREGNEREKGKGRKDGGKIYHIKIKKKKKTRSRNVIRKDEE